MNGQIYCVECLRCPHGTHMSYVCPTCVRALYSRATFQGWRIVDLEVYVRDAWRDYGLNSSELMTWTFHETELLIENGAAWQGKEPPRASDWRVVLPPPHHRVTAWSGSR